MDDLTLSTPLSFYFLLILVLCIIIFLLCIQPRISKRKVENKNEHGSSKFADIKEIKQTFQKEPLNNIQEGGFPVWYEKKNNKFTAVYVDNKSPHHLLVGSTGSGKSVTVVIPECLMFATAKEKRSVIVTDPKGEIFKSTSQVFKDNGYDVITIDFRNPRQSTKINIMQPIIDEWKLHCQSYKLAIFYLSYLFKIKKIDIDKYINDKQYIKEVSSKLKLDSFIYDFLLENKEKVEENIHDKKFYNSSILNKEISNQTLKQYLDSFSTKQILNKVKDNINQSSIHEAEANRLILSLADLIFVEKDSKDPFWLTSSKNLFSGIVGIFLEDYRDGKIREEQINISSVKKFQNSSLTKENQMYLQRNISNRKYGSLSKDYLTSILSASENTYKSITAVFGSKTNIFDDINVENITSVSEFQFSDLGKKPTALFIIVPDEDRAYFQLVTIIIGILYKDLVKFANMPENNGTLPVKIEWILDEFANCPPLDSIEALVSVARSRGMRFQFFIQGFGQLDQVYGKEVSSIIQDNCGLTYLKTNSIDCAETISKKLGKATITTSSINQSTDAFKIGANQTTSLLGRELLTANEIINLKYKTIIFPTVSNPIFRDAYLYSDVFPQYSNCKPINRKVNILKRLNNNYYTVEDMQNYEENNFSKEVESQFQKIDESFEKIISLPPRKKRDRGNVYRNNKPLRLGQLIMKNTSFNEIIQDRQMIDNDVFQLKVNKILNLIEQKEIIKQLDKDMKVNIVFDKEKLQTVINIYEGGKECVK